MKKRLIFGLLLSGLASCQPYIRQGPEGCQITGPTKQGHTIFYEVTGFQPGNAAMKKFVEESAYCLSEDDEPGEYTIYVDDQRTHEPIFSTSGHIRVDDLFGTHKISYGR
jgi:hypothetical protein